MANAKETKAKAKDEAPDTPSALALAEVGAPPEPKHDNLDKVNEHADRYHEAKRKHRWG